MLFVLPRIGSVKVGYSNYKSFDLRIREEAIRLPKSLLIVLMLLLCTRPVLCLASAENLEAPYKFYDQHGYLILETGQSPHIGDQYIHEDNTLYEVSKIHGQQVELIKKIQLTLDFPEVWPVQTMVGSTTLAIYHSHTDETYVPADGTAAKKGQGKILEIGETFAEKLRQKNYLVIHDQTLHDPHDANAYLRSRRTVFKLLKEQPNALFDMHRDSAPIEGYLTKINGQESAKILLVVGRSNPQEPATLEYAKTIKSASDSQYKGLIRGIFIAHGDYNQDLSPQSILVEVGTQYNTLEQANQAVALFADVVPLFIAAQVSQAAPIGPSAENPPQEQPVPSPNYTYNYLSLITTIIIGTGIYLLLGREDQS